MSGTEPVPESPQDSRTDGDVVVEPLQAPLGQTLYANDPPPISPALPPPLPPRKRRFRWGR
jgi:hypothetical protein